jgi:hypothetical protein
MKAYPAVFLVFLLSEKRYREIIFTILFVAVITYISFLCHKGDFLTNLNYVLSGFDIQNFPIFAQSNALRRGVSLYDLVKLIFIQFNIIGFVDLDKFFAIYPKIVFPLFFLLAGYIIFVKQEFWKKVAILVFAMLLFPYMSADYRLLHTFIPMFLFINSANRDKLELFYIVMFGLLLIPKDYYIFPGIISDSGKSDVSIAVVLNILIMLIMMTAIIADGLKKARYK